MDATYKGLGKKSEAQQLIAELNDIFFSEEPNKNFMHLLPKLYKEKYNPAENNVIIKEGDKIKAAVGCYPVPVVAAGRKLRILGIGNVGVSKDCRRKGYMIDLMNMALDMMIKEDYDYSLLGGQRQRYEYFGYVPAGVSLHFNINKGNISRLRNGNLETPFTAKRITEGDSEVLAQVKKFYDAVPFHAERSEEDMLDFLESWDCVAYAVYGGDELKGYFAYESKGNLSEIRVAETEDMLDFLLCAMNVMESEFVTFNAPMFDTAVCDYMSKICCGMSVCHVDQVNILNYGRFIEAFLAIKAERMNLCSGTLNVLVHGYKRDENLSITVDGKNVTVAETDAKPDFELSHMEAIPFFAGNYSAKRLSLPAFAQNWFPVDFFNYQQDNV